MLVKRDQFTDGTDAGLTEGRLMRVARPTTPIRSLPGGAVQRETLYGHPVRQLEQQSGVSRDETSRYCGYISPDDLAPWLEPTHRVAVQRTLLFREPNFKSQNPILISHGALLAIEDIDSKYAQTQDGLYAIADHLAPKDETQPDLAATAEMLLGTPYLWAGNSAFGIDCSGLVQLACQAAQIACPGDSDQQEQHFPEAHAPYQRNDLIFWKGHVAIVASPTQIIHANAHHMGVRFEELDAAIDRIAQQGDGQVTSVRRPTPLRE